MEVEETIERKSYRGFDLVQLRAEKSGVTRWHITRQESGMNCNYGFMHSEGKVHCYIDKMIDHAGRGIKA